MFDSVDYSAILKIYFVVPLIYIYDVICEKMSYGGTNSVPLDQLFSHVCHSIYG